MVRILAELDWYLVFWTALTWMFSGGILYLVYRYGSQTAADSGLTMNSWRTVALLLGFVVSVAMFGTDYPDKGLIVEFGGQDRAVFVGIFLIIAATYVLGYFDTKRQAGAQAAPDVNADVPPASP